MNKPPLMAGANSKESNIMSRIPVELYRFDCGNIFEFSPDHEGFLYIGSRLAYTREEVREMKKKNTEQEKRWRIAADKEQNNED